MLNIFGGLGVAPNQRQERRHRAKNPLAVAFFVDLEALTRRTQRRQNTDWQARIAAGGVDAVLRGQLEPLQAVWDDAPALQAIAPTAGDFCCVLFFRLSGALRVIFVDPVIEVLRLQVWEGQQQVGDVAFGVNDDSRDVVNHCFFKQVDAQPRFAAACHANDHRMGGEVARVIIDNIFCEAMF